MVTSQTSARISLSAGKASERIKPLVQGDLDGLCGVYSIINACSALCPELSKSDQRELFEALIDRLCASDKIPYSAIANGMSRRMLSDLFKPARKFVRKHHEIEVSFDRLPRWQRRKIGEDRTDELFRFLGAELSPVCVAILGLDGTHHHWTVVTGLTDKSLILSDSEAVTRIGRQRCTVEYDPNQVVIDTTCIIVVRRLSASKPDECLPELKL